MTRYSAVALAMVVFGVSAMANGPTDLLVAEWVRVVLRERTATLADYQRFQGGGEGPELDLELLHCRNSGWIPEDSNSKCVAFLKNRADNPRAVLSLFFRCLGRTWTNGLQIGDLHLVESSRSEAEIKRDVFDVEIGSHLVRFFHTVGSDAEAFGELSLVSIDGRSAQDILTDEANSRECRLKMVDRARPSERSP